MRDEGRPGLLAEAVHQVEHAGREPDLLEEPDQDRGEQRRVLGGLEHRGAPADEGRGDLPQRDGDGEVPRGDERRHTRRVANGHRELARQLGGHRQAEEPAALPRQVVAEVDALLDVGPGLAERLAHLPGHQPGQLLLALLEDQTDPEHVVGPLRDGGAAPAGKGAPGGLDRAGHVLCGGGGEGAEDVVVVGRVQAGERPAAGSRDPPPADVVAMLAVFHGPTAMLPGAGLLLRRGARGTTGPGREPGTPRRPAQP